MHIVLEYASDCDINTIMKCLFLCAIWFSDFIARAYFRVFPDGKMVLILHVGPRPGFQIEALRFDDIGGMQEDELAEPQVSFQCKLTILHITLESNHDRYRINNSEME